MQLCLSLNNATRGQLSPIMGHGGHTWHDRLISTLQHVYLKHQSGFQHTPCVSVLRIIPDLCQSRGPLSITPCFLESCQLSEIILIVFKTHKKSQASPERFCHLLAVCILIDFVYQMPHSKEKITYLQHGFGSLWCWFSWHEDVRSKFNNSILSRASVLITHSMCYLTNIRNCIIQHPTNKSIIIVILSVFIPSQIWHMAHFKQNKIFIFNIEWIWWI